MRDERYKFRKGDLVRKRVGFELIGIILYHHLGGYAAGSTYVNVLWINGERLQVAIGSWRWDNTEALSRA